MTRHSIGVAFKESGARAGAFLATRPDWFIERFMKMPTTILWFVLVAFLAISTQRDYHYAMVNRLDWKPSEAWLLFIAGLAGGAITQWVKKRTTNHDYIRATRGQPPTEGNDNGTTTDADGADAGRDVRGAAGAGGRAAGAQDVRG